MPHQLASALCLFYVISLAYGDQDCHVCRYSVESGTVVSGSSEGCKGQFYHDSQVSMMQCVGQCFTSYTKSGNHLTWDRGCAPQCDPIDAQDSPDSWKKCCSENLCNDSIRTHADITFISTLFLCIYIAMTTITS